MKSECLVAAAFAAGLTAGAIESHHDSEDTTVACRGIVAQRTSSENGSETVKLLPVVPPGQTVSKITALALRDGIYDGSTYVHTPPVTIDLGEQKDGAEVTITSKVEISGEWRDCPVVHLDE